MTIGYEPIDQLPEDDKQILAEYTHRVVERMFTKFVAGIDRDVKLTLVEKLSFQKFITRFLKREVD